MDFRTLIENAMITEMARQTENVKLDDVKKTMEELKAAGIDLSNYTFDEIQMAMFLNLDELIRGTTPKHQETVISFWKPQSSNPAKTFRDMRNPFLAALNINLDTVKTLELGKNDKDDRNQVKMSLPRKELIRISKDPEAAKEYEKHGRLKLKKEQE